MLTNNLLLINLRYSSALVLSKTTSDNRTSRSFETGLKCKNQYTGDKLYLYEFYNIKRPDMVPFIELKNRAIKIVNKEKHHFDKF